MSTGYIVTLLIIGAILCAVGALFWNQRVKQRKVMQAIGRATTAGYQPAPRHTEETPIALPSVPSPTPEQRLVNIRRERAHKKLMKLSATLDGLVGNAMSWAHDGLNTDSQQSRITSACKALDIATLYLDDPTLFEEHIGIARALVIQAQISNKRNLYSKV